MRTSSHPSRGSGGGSSSKAPGPDMVSVLAGFCLTLGVGGWYVVILTAFYQTVHEKPRTFSLSSGSSRSRFSFLTPPLFLALQSVYSLGFRKFCWIYLIFYCQSIWWPSAVGIRFAWTFRWGTFVESVAWFWN